MRARMPCALSDAQILRNLSAEKPSSAITPLVLLCPPGCENAQSQNTIE